MNLPKHLKDEIDNQEDFGTDTTEKERLYAKVVQLDNRLLERYEKMCHLEAAANQYKQKMDQESAKLYYREKQVKTLLKVCNKLVLYSIKIVKKTQRGCKRKKAFSYLKKMKKFITLVRG